MSLFCVLVALIFQQSLTEIVVEISQPNGQRILDIAEIYMQQNGRSLPDYLTTLSFSSATDPYNDVQFCKDNNVLSSCQNAVAFNASSSRWEGEEERPTLFILSRDAFFGELIIIPAQGHEHLLLGAEIVVRDGSRPAQNLPPQFQSASAKYTVDMSVVLGQESTNAQAPSVSPAMKIVDTFLYNGDLIALTRVEYLFGEVDKFIILESWITFSGQVKPRLFFTDPATHSLFLPYMHKIEYRVIRNIPNTPESYKGPDFSFAEGTLDYWWRETYSRAYFMFFIRPHRRLDNTTLRETGSDDSSSVKLPDMYLICDCDEIPDREVLAQLRVFGVESNKTSLDAPLHFNMHLFYYNMHWLAKQNWAAPYMISTRGLFSMADISHPRVKGGLYVGLGWHCSYFMSVEGMVRKIESFSHQELNIDDNKDIDHIRSCLHNGLDIFRRPEWGGFYDRLSDEYIAAYVPKELVAFHLEVRALQGSGDG